MKRILPTIVISQFFCTSLWFAGNAVMGDIVGSLNVSPALLANLTSMVQFGFISGTLVFALLSIADRFSPVKVFFTCAIIAAAANLGMVIPGAGITVLMIVRFLVGFFLAGIYPVGMKIAADHYQQGLGKSLGFLVGALVVGSAFPHLLRSGLFKLPWQYAICTTSLLTVTGGLAMLLLVPDGPYRKPGQKLVLNGFMQGFRNPQFRAAAFGYFGHMWELYTFWLFVPVIIGNYAKAFADFNVPLLSFVVMAIGGVSCAVGGLLSGKFGTKRIATWALAISGLCCLLSPLMITCQTVWVFIALMLIWGAAGTADSPLFSTLVAQHAPPEFRGTSLTIVNCVGFAITIVSIQLISMVAQSSDSIFVFMLLAIGPALGLLALLKPSAQAK
ncbi:MFS transporter [Mucilaginibacter myungsuensis]|uniref:MFS transporter n=1 Tax=Mucilaginibacter myungsuensis TaxID=649104 RepID=A0A929L1I8_9SPHI|nr:MFS transporter [Mucilaginibacter myungsuensis]MBE9661546.1 MFS transporter [Mucilaginibacter myungsuensis]MDN3597689.1 MFS transporter [Mucilaginibacter myungsuensis]